MREVTLSIAFVVGVVLMVQSCYYEYPPEESQIDPEKVSFKVHVLPILSKSCGVEQCHDGLKVPDLRGDTLPYPYQNVSYAYRDLVIGNLVTNNGKTYVNTTFPDKSGLLEAINNGVNGLAMPEGGLPERDIELIRAWMLKGALND